MYSQFRMVCEELLDLPIVPFESFPVHAVVVDNLLYQPAHRLCMGALGRHRFEIGILSVKVSLLTFLPCVVDHGGKLS